MPSEQHSGASGLHLVHAAQRRVDGVWGGAEVKAFKRHQVSLANAAGPSNHSGMAKRHPKMPPLTPRGRELVLRNEQRGLRPV